MKWPKKIVDANILLRFFLGDHPEFFQKAKDFVCRVESGQEVVLLTEMVFAEVVWVLHKVYLVPRIEISSALSKVIRFKGIKTLVPKEVFLEALSLYPETRIDIQDLFLAALSRLNQATIITFDRTDFKKLGVLFTEPT
jgi:predicted nucleic acid-binding protein